MSSAPRQRSDDDLPGLGNVQGIATRRESKQRLFKAEDEPVVFAVLLTLIAITLWVFL